MDCQTIAECVGALEPDEYLIVSRSDANMYVQFAGQGWYGWLAEAACNTYILPPERLLTVKQYKRMSRLG